MTLTSSEYKKLQNGSTAPDFEDLKGVDGKEYWLSDFKGKKALLIVFMCNHCPYVIPKIEHLKTLQERYGELGLQVVGINCNDPKNYPADSFENMKKIATEMEFNFIYLFDGSQKTAKGYGAACTPDPFLFDRKMKLAYHGRFDDAHGKMHGEGTTSEMEDAIKQVLEGREVTVQSIPSMGCSIKWK
jgi:peroxiredoxin